MKTVVALHELPRAEDALRELRMRGFERERISLLVPVSMGDEPPPTTSSRETVHVRATPKNVTSSLGSMVVGLAMFSIPAVGPLLAAGPLAAGLAGIVAQPGQHRDLQLPDLLERVGVPGGDADAIARALVPPRALLVIEAADIEVQDLVQWLAHYDPLEIGSAEAPRAEV